MPITKRLVRSNEATTGRATWETKVALKAIVNAVHPDEVTVKDTFQSAWSQKLGVDESSITIKIGDTVLERGATGIQRLAFRVMKQRKTTTSKSSLPTK